MATFPSEEWTKLYVELINGSKEYAEAADTWEGDVAFVFEAEPENGVPDTLRAWFDLWHGECRSYRYGIDEAEAGKSQFVFTAPYSRWKDIIRKDLDPIKGIMQGKIKLKGDLPRVVRYVKASNELVNLATEVPTEFIDGA